MQPDLSPQDRGQKLVDLHLENMNDYAQFVSREQQRVFSETRQGWRNEIKSDPELGGSGYETNMKAVARMRDMLVPKEHRASFDKFLRVTGAGDHPEFIRVLLRAAKFYDEPAPNPPGPGFKPPADIGRKPGGDGRRSTLYDHPNSEAKRR